MTITEDDVLDHLAGRRPDRVRLAGACELPDDAPVAEIVAALVAYQAELAARR